MFGGIGGSCRMSIMQAYEKPLSSLQLEPLQVVL